jgi:hypothetical protein
MSDIAVTFGVGSPEEDARLVDALNTFLGQHLTGFAAAEELPGVLIRTGLDATGNRTRQFIFESGQWAEDFMTFWALHGASLPTS